MRGEARTPPKAKGPWLRAFCLGAVRRSSSTVFGRTAGRWVRFTESARKPQFAPAGSAIPFAGQPAYRLSRPMRLPEAAAARPADENPQADRPSHAAPL